MLPDAEGQELGVVGLDECEAALDAFVGRHDEFLEQRDLIRNELAVLRVGTGS
jgi:hypothetical protein